MDTFERIETCTTKEMIMSLLKLINLALLKLNIYLVHVRNGVLLVDAEVRTNNNDPSVKWEVHM